MRRGIRERGRSRFTAVVIAVSALTLVALPSSASASFHLTKVTEVYAGTGTDDYVELQAYQAGQNQVAGHEITAYDTEGALVYTFTFPSAAPNAQTQRTILLGAGPLANGVNPDFTDPTLAPLLNKSGGAVCFDSAPVDCVSWGDFTAVTPLPGAAGTPVAPAGIPNGSSITRSIAAGCATLLEASDDTDNSAADFTVTTVKTPQPNSATPAEKVCGAGGGGGSDAPQTTIDKGPKKKTTNDKAKFKFSSDDQGATFECSLDGKKFKSCSSPVRLKKLKTGRHVFEVRAVVGDAEDASPAAYKWKVIKK